MVVIVYFHQDLLEYKLKYRILKVRTLDGALKTLQVDDSHSVGHLMIPICSRMGQLALPDTHSCTHVLLYCMGTIVNVQD